MSSAGDPAREPSAAQPRLLDRLGKHSQQQGSRRSRSVSTEPPPSPPSPHCWGQDPDSPVPSHTGQAPAVCAFLCPLGVGAEHSAARSPGLPGVPPHVAPLVSPLSMNDPPWSLCSQELQELQTRPSPRTTPHTTCPQLGTETASRNPGHEARIT